MSLNLGEMRSLIRLYGGGETRTGPLKAITVAWQRLTPDEWGKVLPEFLTLRNYGAGEVPAGMREIHLNPHSGAEARLGLEIIDGDERGFRGRIISVDRADPAMVRIRVEPYSGSFT